MRATGSGPDARPIRRRRAQEHILAGFDIVVDLDLEKFFDRVNHDILMGLVAKRVADKRLLRLIRGFLTAGVLDGGLVGPTTKGTPQGGPLSPLLSNLMLDVLDKELETRPPLRPLRRRLQPLRAVPAGGRAGHGERDQLPRPAAEADGERSQERGGPPVGAGLPGLQLHGRTNAPAGYLAEGARPVLRVRELTRRTTSVRFTRLVEELSRYLVGWRGYFGFCEDPFVLLRLDQWTRRRLRAVVWKHWKHGRTRFAALRRRGVSKTLAAKTASSAHGPWRVSLSPALCIALPNAFFDRLGLASVAAGHAA